MARLMPKLGLVVGLLLASAQAFGHGRSSSYSEWSTDRDGVRVRVRLRAVDANALELGLAGPLSQRLTGLFDVVSGERCVSDGAAEELNDELGFRSFRWRYRCVDGVEHSVDAQALFRVMPQHVHLASWSGSRVMTRDAPTAVWNEGAVEVDPVVSAGVRHILGGWDHLCFLLALVLAASRFRELLGLATAFTVGHSLTLALTAFHQIAPAGPLGEALIAASIVAAAIASQPTAVTRSRGTAVLASGMVLSGCALAPSSAHGALALTGASILVVGLSRLPPRRAQWIGAVLFGALHGMGFAGGLKQLSPSVELSTVLQFNLGVELGQLACITLLFAALSVWKRRELPIWPWSSALMAIGSYWFTARIPI